MARETQLSRKLANEQRRWAEGMRQLAKTSSRSAADFLNGQMLALMILAIKKTKKADFRKVMWQLGRDVSAGHRSQGAARFRGATVGEGWSQARGGVRNSFAARIVNWGRKKRGQEMIWGERLEEAALKLTKGVAKSMAFIKSGWLPALRIFGKATFGKEFRKRRSKDETDGAKQLGLRNKGGAKLARADFIGGEARAVAWNEAMIKPARFSRSRQSNPMPIAQRGLRLAFAAQSKDHINVLRKRLGKLWKSEGYNVKF